MFQKIIKWIFIASLKQKKLFIKDNFLTDNEENFTILMRVIEKTTPNTNDLLIIDIGAYDGRSSILFSEKFPKNSIIAFEPNKNSYQLALKNCADYPNIKIYNIALSATTAIAEFNITKIQYPLH